MKTIPYEILIRGHAGQLSGCHVIDSPGADARPITTNARRLRLQADLATAERLKAAAVEKLVVLET